MDRRFISSAVRACGFFFQVLDPDSEESLGRRCCCVRRRRKPRRRRTRDLCWFLQRMRSVDHLPELEKSHTAMSSTWDRTGANADNADFKRIEKDGRNILLDVDGPGCIHRIFTGVLGPELADTRLQIFIDNAEKPVFDMPVLKFFDDDERSPALSVGLLQELSGHIVSDSVFQALPRATRQSGLTTSPIGIR